MLVFVVDSESLLCCSLDGPDELWAAYLSWLKLSGSAGMFICGWVAWAGTIGHVAHGKSTLVKSISGVHTVRFKNEQERNITIKLGYANAKIFKCTSECERPDCYAAYGSAKEDSVVCER